MTTQTHKKLCKNPWKLRCMSATCARSQKKNPKVEMEENDETSPGVRVNSPESVASISICDAFCYLISQGAIPRWWTEAVFHVSWMISLVNLVDIHLTRTLHRRSFSIRLLYAIQVSTTGATLIGLSVLSLLISRRGLTVACGVCSPFSFALM